MTSIKNARAVAVPLIIIETADPQQTILSVVKDLNGTAKQAPVFQWDFVRAFTPLNEAGRTALAEVAQDPAMVTNPTEALSSLANAPEKSLVFFHNVHLFWKTESVLQGLWNLRDIYKSSGATFVGLCASASTLPAELKNDVIVLTEALPTLKDVEEIAAGIIDAASKAGARGLESIDREKVYDTLLGLSAFGAEQVLSMSISADGLDMEGMSEKKRRMIEQTPGLSIWRGGETFADVAGYENAVNFIKKVTRGNGKPRAILFIDEIDKAFAAVNSDSSGTTQDQHAVVLKWMQDSPNVAGMLFVSPPGCGKSMIAKAAGNDADIWTVAMDLSAMKGSLVGQSEQNTRAAFAAIDAIAQGSVLVIATCNATSNLPPEMRRRFKLGTFYFPLPGKKTRDAGWSIYEKKYSIKKQERPEDNGWTVAEIRGCCEVAWRLDCTLKEAAGYIVPVSVSASAQMEKLATEAHRRYINAETPGLYEYGKLATKPTTRRMEV